MTEREQCIKYNFVVPLNANLLDKFDTMQDRTQSSSASKHPNCIWNLLKTQYFMLLLTSKKDQNQ